MSQDLEQFHDIIEQLKPMINEPEFNQVLSQVAATVPKQKRFLIKMELKRLARPCVRLIDLRGHVDGECRLYEHESRPHYLDEVAIEVFERQIRLFGDNYTIGVYEAVSNTENNFRVMYRKQKEEGTSEDSQQSAAKEQLQRYCARVLAFDDFARRAEERMNFAINIELFSELNKSIPATTVDISVSGLKIRVSKEQMFKPGERLTVQFRGLEGEFVLDKKSGVPFSIVNIDRTKQEQRLCLKRIYDAHIPSFDAFLERFIHGNKRRYKVNMNNTLKAIRNKTYEQYYVPNFTSIPIYIELVEGEYRPKYVLANDCNKEAVYYWADELFQLKLGYLFSHQRISQWMELAEEARETYIYVFNHIKDEKIYFYSATQEELEQQPELKKIFLGYGARKASWRIYKLQLTAIAPSQCHLPLSIPDSISDAVKRQNQAPAPRLMARLKNLCQIAVLTDVTDDISTYTYQKLKITRAQLPALKVFGHPRNKLPIEVNMFRFKYLNQRLESRFLLRSKVIVTCDELELEGVSEDISVHGLKIELQKFFHLEEGTLVYLNFPQLQKVTSKYDIGALPYKVKNISPERNVLNLQVVSNENNTTALRFFEELIKTNRSKLKAYKEEEEIPGIGEALRHLYARNIVNVAFFIKKEGIHMLPDAIATTARSNRLAALLSHKTDPGEYSLYPIYEAKGLQTDFIQNVLKRSKTTSRPIMRELFVAFDPSQANIGDSIRSQFAEQFKDDEQRRMFISSALRSGQFIAIKVFLARTGRPDADLISSELSYVGSYAVHKAKVLEEQLWNICGVGELIDVTDEAMSRFRFREELIVANRLSPSLNKLGHSGIEQMLKA
jgi:hypothetical protein